MESELSFDGKSRMGCSSALRAGGLQSFVSGLLFFGLVVGLGAPVTAAEQESTPMAPAAEQEPNPMAPAATVEPKQVEIRLDRAVAPAEVKKRRGKHAQAKKQRDRWWRESRKILLQGLKLTPDQNQKITAIITVQKRRRTEYSKLDVQLAVARSANDLISAQQLRTQVREAKGKIESLHEVLDSLRGVLTEKQRVTFDVNRAKLIAESQSIRQARKKKRAGGKKTSKDASPAKTGEADSIGSSEEGGAGEASE